MGRPRDVLRRPFQPDTPDDPKLQLQLQLQGIHLETQLERRPRACRALRQVVPTTRHTIIDTTWQEHEPRGVSKVYGASREGIMRALFLDLGESLAYWDFASASSLDWLNDCYRCVMI